MASTTPTVYLGNFNFHLDDTGNSNALKFSNLFYSLNFTQHVLTPTHRSGHILDNIITHRDDTLVSNVHVDDLISDNNLVLCTLSKPRPDRPRKQISIRKYRDIDIAEFTADLEERLSTSRATSDPAEQLEFLTSALIDLLNKQAPQSVRDVVVRPRQLWYTLELVELKKARRRTEDTWRDDKNKKRQRRIHQLGVTIRSVGRHTMTPSMLLNLVIIIPRSLRQAQTHVKSLVSSSLSCMRTRHPLYHHTHQQRSWLIDLPCSSRRR